MEISELFEKYGEVSFDNRQSAKLESYKIVLESGLYLIQEVTPKIQKKDRNDQVNDALTVFQMVFGKGIAISSLIRGITSHNSINGKTSEKLIDPTTIAALARTQLEAYTNFHNIFNSPTDQKLTDLLYNMWVISGLNYRQKSVNDQTADEHKKKAEREKLKIDKLTQEIYDNPYYIGLEEKDQKWINERIKKREFELIFKDGKFLKPGWRELFLSTGVNNMLEPLYSIMSGYIHPSNISVFQYAQMFEGDFNEEMAFTVLEHSKLIMSFMISEYCKYFQIAKDMFDQLPVLNRLVIDSHIRYFRGVDYQISNIHDEYAPLFQKEYEKRINEMNNEKK